MPSLILISARLIATLLCAGLPCTIQSPDGSTTKGELTALDMQFAILSGDNVHSIPLDKIQRITADNAPSLTPPEESVRVALMDDSQLVLKQLTMESATVTLSPWSGASQPLPRKAIHSIRFGSQSEAKDQQWNEIANDEHVGDTLIIRKQDTLDYLDGIVLEIDDESVIFEYDGDEIPVKRSKLEGILFFRSTKTEAVAPDPAMDVAVAGGSRLKGEELTLEDNHFRILTLAGVEWRVPVADVATIDFGVGRTLFLSDVEPATLTVTPQIASTLQSELTQLLYQPLRDVAWGNRTLQLRFPAERRTETYSKGLCLHSRTEMDFRLGRQYRQFHTVAGIDPELGERGAARLTILADGDSLFDATIKGGEEPVTLDLDISRRRRLTIVVDYADKLDIADRVHLCDLRVTK